MALETLQIDASVAEIPSEVSDLVEDLADRVGEFLKGKPFAEKGFVACDHLEFARQLLAIRQLGVSTGSNFCEWGSGFGGATCIASMLGFEAYGIELNPEVLEHSIVLATDYDLEVEFIEGSFIPPDTDDLVDEAFMEHEGDLTLETHYDSAYDELGREIEDFDVIFVFPWPNEADLLSRIFDRFAAAGAILMIFNDFNGMSVYRKSFD